LTEGIWKVVAFSGNGTDWDKPGTCLSHLSRWGRWKVRANGREELAFPAPGDCRAFRVAVLQADVTGSRRGSCILLNVQRGNQGASGVMATAAKAVGQDMTQITREAQ